MFKIFRISFFEEFHLTWIILLCLYVLIFLAISLLTRISLEKAPFLFPTAKDQWSLKINFFTIYNFDIAYIRVCACTHVCVCMCVYSVGEKSDYYLENEETLMIA